MSGKGLIGVFDSGFGGLHTLRHLVDALPEYEYVYLGDSARAPYGSRPSEEIYAFSIQAIEFLFAQGCDLVIFACNTASSDALRKIQQDFLPEKYPDKKVLGVLIPIAEEAIGITVNKRIGILATEGTVRSGAFVREITKLDPVIQVFQQAAPRLVPLIESGGYASVEMQVALAGYMEPLLASGIDTLILGCTHYGFAIDAIRRTAGASITVVSDSHAVPTALRVYLARHGDFEHRLSHNRLIVFYTTGSTEVFDEVGSSFFRSPIASRRALLGEGGVKSA